MIDQLKKVSKGVFTAITLATLISCSGSRESYETIDPFENLTPKSSSLELPPDLLDTSSEAVTTQALTAEDVVPTILGVTSHDDGQKKWLEVAAPAEKVWPRIVEYWGLLGATLVKVDPKTGIMETDWVQQLSEEESEKKRKGLGGTNLVFSILADITDQETALDKYTLRVERANSSNTLVYLSHRGTKKIQIGSSSIGTHPSWEWVETGEDGEKVSILLQAISYQLNPENV